jgi:hypothetical protein
MTGGGAAALAGLVFVAMSINLDVVAQNCASNRRVHPEPDPRARRHAAAARERCGPPT